MHAPATGKQLTFQAGGINLVVCRAAEHSMLRDFASPLQTFGKVTLARSTTAAACNLKHDKLLLQARPLPAALLSQFQDRAYRISGDTVQVFGCLPLSISSFLHLFI